MRHKYQVNILQKMPKMTIAHHLDINGKVFGTSNRKILKYTGTKKEKIGNFPFWYPRDFFGFSRLSSRASRRDKCNIYVNSHGNILGIRGGAVYSVSDNKPTKFMFNIQGDCVLHRGICEDPKGWSYFGEYFMNPGRVPVHVYRISPDFNIWKASLADEKVIQKGIVEAGVGKYLNEIIKSGNINEEKFLIKSIEQLMRHIEIRRKDCLNKFDSQISDEDKWLEKHDIAQIQRYGCR